MSQDDQACTALQYLLDEGFLSLSVDSDGDPCVRLTTDLSDTRRAIRDFAKDKSDWWKQ